VGVGAGAEVGAGPALGSAIFAKRSAIEVAVEEYRASKKAKKESKKKDKKSKKVGADGQCPPRQRRSCNSRNEDQNAFDDVASTIHQSLQEGREEEE
jgi:hypothetical protein